MISRIFQKNQPIGLVLEGSPVINADASDSISGGSPVNSADAAWQNQRPQKKETEVSLILDIRRY